MLLKKISISIVFSSILYISSMQAMFKCSCFKIQNQVIPMTEQSIHRLNSVHPQSEQSIRIIPVIARAKILSEEQNYTQRFEQEPHSVHRILNHSHEAELSILRIFMEHTQLKPQDNNLKSDEASSASHSDASHQSHRSQITLTINGNNQITNIKISSIL